jgi:hypothetical protein
MTRRGPVRVLRWTIALFYPSFLVLLNGLVRLWKSRQERKQESFIVRRLRHLVNKATGETSVRTYCNTIPYFFVALTTLLLIVEQYFIRQQYVLEMTSVFEVRDWISVYETSQSATQWTLSSDLSMTHSFICFILTRWEVTVYSNEKTALRPRQRMNLRT